MHSVADISFIQCSASSAGLEYASEFTLYRERRTDSSSCDFLRLPLTMHRMLQGMNCSLSSKTEQRVVIPFNYLFWQPGVPVSSGNNNLFLWHHHWEVARLLPIASCNLCLSERHVHVWYFISGKSAKHSEIIINLQTTKLLVASEVYLLLVISGVCLDSLKNAAALLRMISPFPTLFILKNGCMPTAYQDLSIWTCDSENFTNQLLSVWI